MGSCRCSGPASLVGGPTSGPKTFRAGPKGCLSSLAVHENHVLIGDDTVAVVVGHREKLGKQVGAGPAGREDDADDVVTRPHLHRVSLSQVSQSLQPIVGGMYLGNRKPAIH